MRIHYRKNSFLPLTAALALLVNSATALTITWNGAAGGAGNWNAANWVSGTPVAGDLLQFGGVTTTTTANNLTADTSFIGINLTNNGSAGQTSAFTLAGNRITLGGNIVTTAVTGTALTDTISLAMVLNGNRSITTNALHNLTISGVISETGGARTLTKTGGGTLTLTGNNSFTGGINWSSTSGVVIAGHNNALGSGTVGLNGTGGSFLLAEGITINNALTVGGQGNNKGLGLQSGATSGTYSGNIVNSEEVGGNFDLSADTGGTLTVSGVISSGNANAGFEKTGAGTVILTGANTYTGTTTLSAGTLSLGNGGTTGRLTATTAIAINNTSNLTINRSDAFSQATDLGAGVLISGTGSFTQAGAGTTTLTAANTYTGGTTIKNGTLALDSAANRLAIAGAVVLGDTSTAGKLVLGGTTVANQTLTALTTTGSGGSVVGGNPVNSTLTLNIASSNIFAGALGGAGTNENNLSLTKTGVGTLTLSNTANTFNGQLLVDAGTVQVTKLENTGTASSTGAGASSIRLGAAATATLEYNGTTDSSTNRQIQVGNNAANAFGATILNNSASGKLTFTNANFSAAASSAATQARVLTLGGSYTGAVNEIQGVISDNTAAAVSLTKTGVSTWQLSGANTYTGATTITTGTLALGSGGTTGRLTATSAITNNSNLTINRSDAFTQATDLGAGVAITGTGSFTQAGAGTTTLTAANTYTGATNVTGGVLAVNGSLANTTTTVGTGATLQGSGSIGGSVTVQGGGTLATGTSIESLTTGALSLQGLSTFAYEINNDAAAIVAGDLTAVTGNLTFDLTNAAILTLTDLGSGSWSVGAKLTLISYSGTWNGGLFSYGSTLADDSTITFSGMDWLFNYNDTVAGTNYTTDLTGTKFVTMTAVPEPNVAALLGGLGTIALLRRRR